MRSVKRLDRAQDGAFDYLLRKPRHARRWRRRTWITACIVAFVALASLAWAIGG
jgi:predicted lysophospholipase L1 biosynthesis ABC-type transport system permease subunit